MEYFVNQNKMHDIEKKIFSEPDTFKRAKFVTTLLVYLHAFTALALLVLAVSAGNLSTFMFVDIILLLLFPFIPYLYVFITGKKMYNISFLDMRKQEKLIVNGSHVEYMFYSLLDKYWFRYEFDLSDITAKEKHPDVEAYRLHGDIELSLLDDDGIVFGSSQRQHLALVDYFDGINISELLKNIKNC